MAGRIQKIVRWLVGADEQRVWNDTGAGPWFTVGGDLPYVTPETAFNLSAVWACQTLIADNISTLPVDTYRKRGKTREETVPPAWVEEPNPETDRVDYDVQRILSLLGWGNSYELLVRQAGSSDAMAPVLERWVIAPQCVDIRRDQNRNLAYFVEGTQVPTGNIQHIRGYRLPGAVYGMSVIEKARQSMGMGQSAENFGAKLYANGVNPSGVFEVPQLPAEASKEVVDRLREQFAERYGGPNNAGRPMALTGGTKWSQITLNPVDAQFLETRKFQIEEFARWFRVPLHKIQSIMGNASQGGGNGLEQMAIEYAGDTLLTWTIRLERADSKLLPRGQYAKYNVDAYVRADMKTRNESLAIRRQNGVLNADEWRALEDEQPIGGQAGSVYWMPVNMTDANNPTPAPAPVPQGSNP